MKALSASMIVIFVIFVATIGAAGYGSTGSFYVDFTEVFCGTAPPAFRTEPVVRPPHEGPLTIDVSIASFAFTPPNLTINVGDTVRWTNNDGRTHTATSDSSVWDSGGIAPTQTFSFTFNDAGKFPYHCSIHPFMTANITVQGMSSPTPTDTATPSFTPTLAATDTPTSTPTDTPMSTPTGAATPSVSGVITYGNAIGNPVPPRFVKNVSVAGTGTPPVGPVITGLNGQYTLTGFGSGPYTIRATKPGGPNGAITSNDAARVAQGVAGSVPFVSQNQRFTADASGNGTISSNDAALIARFAAGLTGTGNVGQWKFFVPGAPSPLPTAPQTYNDHYDCGSFSCSGLTDQDFVALLVGEASGNYNTATHPRPAGKTNSKQWTADSENGISAERRPRSPLSPSPTAADKEFTSPSPSKA